MIKRFVHHILCRLNRHAVTFVSQANGPEIVNHIMYCRRCGHRLI